MSASPTLNAAKRITLSATAGEMTNIVVPTGGAWAIVTSSAEFYLKVPAGTDGADKGSDGYETRAAGTWARALFGLSTFGVAGSANSQVVEVTITGDAS